MNDYYDSKDEVIITEKQGHSIVDLIKFFKMAIRYPMTVYEAKGFAALLKSDGRIVFQRRNVDESYLKNQSICNVEYVKTMSQFEQDQMKQEYFYGLLKRGAEGDAAAAIEYCKAEFEGKVSHEAFA